MRVVLIVWLFVLQLPAAALRTRGSKDDYDAIVYGATPAGIQAALAIAGEGRTALLVTSEPIVGGMMTGGLGATDTGNSSAIGGASGAFFRAVCAAYNRSVPASGGCFTFEPHVAMSIFTSLLSAASSRVSVLLNSTLVSAAATGSRVTSVAFADTAIAETATSRAELRSLASLNVSAQVFIDATYEGDLLAAADLPTAIGREGRVMYNESHAGVLEEPSSFGQHQFKVHFSAFNATTGNPLPLISRAPPGAVGDGDGKVQAYNFRLCMTSEASNRAAFPVPEVYDPLEWEIARRHIAVSNVTRLASLMNLVAIPGSKTDTNNNGPISTDFIGASYDWPAATPRARRDIFNAHVEYTLGFFYFLQHDEAIPPALRAEALQWGLAADEFLPNRHLPSQLYVREGRRLVGDFVFTQRDRQTSIHKNDSIGLFSYNIDSHHVQRYVNAEGGVYNEGDFELYGGPLGQIPYRVLLPPRGVAGSANVLAPVPLSASHMGYGCLRLEPQLMILGQSAGIAATMAMASGVDVQDIDVGALQSRLRELGQKIDL